MKKIKLILSFLLLTLLCACSNNKIIFDSSLVSISIVDSEFFTPTVNKAKVTYGDDFNTTIVMREGYGILSCSYMNNTITALDDGNYSITFKNVKKPQAVTIDTYRINGFKTENKEFNTSIKYYFNDGSNDFELLNYTLSYHIRQNTWNAHELKRDGYTLNGWNTKSDLTGNHIGLGSRVTVEENKTLELYAEWVKWEDKASFLYKKNDDDTITLTGYKGSGTDEYLCLPEEIDGYVVTSIANTFTTNIPCKEIKSENLIIPNTITYIENYAFKGSKFINVYFSDNLSFESYKCFDYNITHYYINAYQNPRFQTNNYNVRFADNIDLLIKYQSEKKMVLYGGCNLAYGIYSPMLEKEFNNYKVINCGLNGEFNSLFQMEVIMNYLNKDDIFIHSAEQMNGYQFLNKLLVDSRMFAMVEGNYDLFALADFSYSSYIIEAYTDYNKLRLDNDECSYSDNPGFFNTYGDYLEDRDYYELNEISRDISYTENWRYDVGVLHGDNIALLGSVYDEIASKGVTLYFAHSPMNLNSSSHTVYEDAKEFESDLREVLKPYSITVIGNATDYIFKGRYFFDTDYHLNFYGAELRTEQLILDLKKAGVN